MRNVVLLGSTGSIGTSTIKVANDLPKQIRLIGLAAGNNAELLGEQATQHRPKAVSISDPAKAAELQKQLGDSVRVIRDPLFGKIGEVSALPSDLASIPTESEVRVLEVTFANGARAVIPRTNIEVIEGSS